MSFVLIWHFVFMGQNIHGLQVQTKRWKWFEQQPLHFINARMICFYLIVEFWILVVMRDNSISICGKNRPCRFSINTLQKKEIESPFQMQVFKCDAMEPHTVWGICEPRAMAKPMQLSPWPCKIQIIYSHSWHTSDKACRMFLNFQPSKKCNSKLVNGKKLNIFYHVKRKHSQIWPIKLTPLMPLGDLNMRGIPSASQQRFLDAHCTVGKEKSF